MRTSVLELSEMLGASIKGNQEARDIVRVITDTRNMGVEAGAVFAAISGVNHDGHIFISQAYSKGVRVFICEHEVDFMGDDDATFLIVPDTLKALQKWALLHRRKFQIPVIAITGSNGKTVVKEWLNQLLAEDYQICRSPRSFNSQLGVALSLLQLEPYHQLAIFEAGISQPGEMDMLQDMIQPEMGVFTFAGTAHAENFLSERQLIGEKLKLFSHCHTIICPQRTEMLELLHEQTHH
ncbi:MAG: Mur ligase family protein, partial [Flavobacteriales bacterium]